MTTDKFIERLKGSEKQIAWATDIINEYFLNPMQKGLDEYIETRYEEAVKGEARKFKQPVIEDTLSGAAKCRWTINAGEWIKRKKASTLEDDMSKFYWLGCMCDDIHFRVERMYAIEKGMVLVSHRTLKLYSYWGLTGEYPIWDVEPFEDSLKRFLDKGGKTDILTIDDFIRTRWNTGK